MSQATQPKKGNQPKAPAVQPREVKILMLHGFTQSGPTFRGRTRAMEKLMIKALAPFHLLPVLIYPSAPIRLRLEDNPGYVPPEEGDAEEPEEEPDSWAWWRSDEATGVYKQFSQGMASLVTHIAEAGGIDGVMGFSQGAAAAALLASALEPERQPPPTVEGGVYDWTWVEKAREANQHRPLKFAVIYSGFFAPPPEFTWMYEPHIQTPTFHCLGGLDTVVSEERSQGLIDRCVEPTVVVHPGSHYVPVKKEWVMPVTGYIKEHVKDSPEQGEKVEAKASI